MLVGGNQMRAPYTERFKSLQARLLFGSVAGSAALLQTPQVYAQYDALEEVTVTSRQRVESVQEVPVSVSVLTGDAITALNLTTSEQLADQTPNVVMVQGNFGLAAPIISIRGITNSNFSATSNSPVSFYADDIVINNIQPQGFALYDIERVEMLRGPQGTLFGRNSTSGAISVHSRMPTQELSGFARIGLGNFSMQRYEGAVSGALIEDKLAARLSGVFNSRDGLVHNPVLNKDEGEVDNFSLRSIFQFWPSENMEAVLKLQHSEGSGEGVLFHNSIGDNPLTVAVEQGGDAVDYKRIELGLSDRYEELEASQATLKLGWQVSETLSFTSLTGFMKHQFDHANDDDGTAAPILHESSDSEQEQFTQEFRLNYYEGNIDAVVGAFYIDEKVDTAAAFETSHIFNIQGFPGRFGSANGNVSNLESWALFGHVKYALTEQWGLSAGLRYSRDERDLDLYTAPATAITAEGEHAFTARANHQPLDATFQPAVWQTVTDEDSWSEVSGDVGVQYFVDENKMLYAGYARGFKGGSFNTVVLNAEDVVAVDPEIVDSFEVGLKSQWADNTLQFNAAAFYYDYQDFQAFEYVTVGFQVNSVLFSIDEAESYGLEMELSWVPTENLGVDLGIGYTKSEVKKISNAPFGIAIREGNEFRNAPAWNFNGSVYYYWALPGGNWGLTSSADFVFVDEYFSSFINEPNSTAGDYWQFNARFRFADATEAYGLTLWVENLFDETMVTGRFPGNFSGYGADFATASDRRTFGVTADYRF
jgi:iron complex outermembrane receptor protein